MGTIAAAQAAVHVLVLDASGAPIRGAAIVLRVPDAPDQRYVSAANGEAAIPLPARTPVDVSITAEGFAEGSVRLFADSGPLLRVILAPAPLAMTVDVAPTAGDNRADIPASTTVVTSGVLLTSAAGALDDVLRSTPGFSLFRRSSSRTANPTTQGVTLRGVSGSGASRTLVLADSVPLNDPFGSWVYWNRVPEVSIDKVEVVRGAAGDVWGADALGGVVRLALIQPTHSRARAVVEGGSRGTFRASAYAGVQQKGWTLSAGGETTRTDGAYTVAEEDRGVVDVPASSDYSNGNVTAGWRDGIWQAEVFGGLHEEHRGNGTPLQVNDTSWRQFGGRAGGALFSGFWQIQASGGRQTYSQSFTAVAPGRQTERLTSEQRIPTDFMRAGGQWARQAGPHDMALGIEWHRTDGIVNETRYPVAGAPTLQVPAGGVEQAASAFARVQFALGHAWTLGVGTRFDAWHTTPSVPSLASHSAGMFSPRVALSRGAGRAAAHVALSRAYRAPTLNELYRGFRAGNVVTDPNDRLGPERLTGLEGGLVVRGRSWSARGTGFVNVLDDAIANLTIQATPLSIVRQRTNSDRIRAAGAEVEAEWRPFQTLTLNAQVAFTDSRFRESAANPDLVGNVVPQVPAWSAGGGVTWTDPRLLTVALQARGTSRAFDDDLNTLPLAGFGVVDLYIGRALPRSVHVFVAAENLFDVQYDVARTPLRSIGWPRSVRAGVRVFAR